MRTIINQLKTDNATVTAPVIVEHSGDVVLTASDMNKVHVFTSAATITLPEITSALLNKFLKIIKATSGNIVINSGGSDTLFTEKDTSVSNTASDEQDAIIDLLAAALTEWRLNANWFGSWISS